MKKSLYVSIISKLSIHVPLIAKGMFDLAISKRGLTAGSASPLDVLQILREELNPKLATYLKGTNSILLTGTSLIILGADQKVQFSNPYARKLIEGLNVKSDFNLSEFLKALGIKRTPTQGGELEVYDVIRQNGEKFKVVVLVYHALTLILIHDETLSHELELDLASAYRSLAHEGLRNQELAQYINAVALLSETDLGGVIVTANEKFCEISGYSKEELIGRKHSIVNSSQHPKEFWTKMWHEISAGKTWSGLVCNRSKTGKLYWVQSTMFPRFDEQGRIVGYASVRIDVTEQIEIENRLAHQNRLASIGELAAGVAHEINNPLAIASGFLERALLDLKESPQNIESVLTRMERTMSALTRIKNIVEGLGSLARTDSVQFEPVILQTAVMGTLSLIGEHFEKMEIKVEFKAPAKDIVVNGSAGRIQQVILNLLTNARDATENLPLRKITIELQINDKNRAELIVTDNGKGIPEAIQARIFEAFYTTKAAGRGTGLGLSIVTRIVSDLGGAIRLVSTPNVGTQFTIELPLFSGG